MASTRPARGPDRTSRLGLAVLTFAGAAVLVWLVASLALSAFG